MKKTTKTVFARVLSLALVMALVLTSIVSSFAFTASAEDVKEFTGNYVDFENDGNVPDGTSLDIGGYYSIAQSPTADHGSFSLKRSYGPDNVTFRIYKKFVAGYKYSFSIDYYFEANTESYAKYTPWFNLYVGSEATSTGVYNDTYGKWVKCSITYEPKNDATYCDLICAEVNGYFDNIKIIENTNTAAYQSYDFDNVTPTGVKNFNIVAEDSDNSAMKLTHAASGNKDHIFKLDYALTAEKLYKVSFDYKGSIKARPYLFNSSNQWGTHQCVSIFGDSEIVFKSNDWARWETVVYAEHDHTGMDFLLVGSNVITDINTDYLYVDNFVIEEYTPGVDKYEIDFEDGKTFAGGCTQYANDGVVADPLDSTNKVFYKVASGNTIRQYYIMTPQLAAGHNYIVTFKAYAAMGDWTGFEKRGFGGTVQKGITGTGKWESYSYEFTPDWDEDYFCFNGKTAIYIDDFKIVDLTTDNDYYEDFSNPDDITLLKNSNVNVEYVMDEEAGKNIAVLTWSSSPNIDSDKIRIPYVLKDGVDYRVKVTYKNSDWWCPFYNGAVKSAAGEGSYSSPNEWKSQYWYVTGSGNSDYFMLTTNSKDLVLQIKDIKIEKMTGVKGDLSNDGNVDANDLAMVKRVLLDFMDDDVFMKAGDVNGDGQYNILDFIALKKSITPVPTVVDEAVSVNEVAYASSNIAVDKTGASIFGDSSSFKTAVSGEDAYLIYELRGGITEAAVEYHVSANFMGDFIFEVSRDAKKWTTITANDIAKEEINSNSYVRVTEYFGNLGYYSYLKITFPEISAEKGEENYFAEIRKVQINGLDAKALYDMCGYNSALREPQTIYVSNSGNDNNNGLSEAAPVKTLEAAFGRMFVPGDKVLLKKGDTFTGEAKILTSGTKEAPIVIGSYGVGEKPIITNFNKVAITVTGEYVEIEDIAFTCETALSGIRFYALKDAQLYGANSGVKVSGCSFYKINSVADGKRSHNRDTGGIAFKASGNKPAWFDGITVENNSFDTVARNAVLTTSDWAARDITQTWGKKNFALENNPVFLSKNILIKNNSIKNNGGDAITLIGSDGALIEYNTVADSALLYNYNYKKDEDTKEYIYDENGNRVISNVAWASIWCHSSDNCVIQYNEVYGNRADNKGQDLQAFDIDLACNNCVVQYNYSHDNAGGFMLLCGVDSADNGGVSGAIVRYNLSVNDGGANMYVFDITGSVSDSQIYNNTIYCGNNNVRLVNLANYAKATVKSSNTVFTNNIFYAEEGVTVKWGYGDSVTTPAFQNASFINNVFYNISEPHYEDLITVDGSIYTDPQFVNGGAENNDLANGNNYKVQNTGLLNSGLVIENNGGKDYFGNLISANSTLMGAIS